jgi:hypothetical protein
MKIEKTASGSKKVTMSKTEWTHIGKQTGWLKKAQWDNENAQPFEPTNVQEMTNDDQGKKERIFKIDMESLAKKMLESKPFRGFKSPIDIYEPVLGIMAVKALNKWVNEIEKRYGAELESSGTKAKWNSQLDAYWKKIQERQASKKRPEKTSPV